MGKINIYKTVYGRFKGVDYANPPPAVEKSRSPYAVNVIPDAEGFPEKRTGWRTLTVFDGRINGIYEVFAGNKKQILVHAGTSLYRWDKDTNEKLLIKEGINDDRSAGFSFDGKFYLLTGREYLVYDGESLKAVSEDARVPRYIIGRKPSGGGVIYERANLICDMREVSFLADGASKKYILPNKNIAEVVSVKIEGRLLAEKEYKADLAAGTVTFTTAPKKHENSGGVAGEDNVFIVYRYAPEGYAERINRCTLFARYGKGGNDRIVLSGNEKYKNLDWISASGDPSYFPDTGYTAIGTENTAIMGYCHIGQHLVIIKEKSGEEGTVFFRTAISENGETFFTVKQAISGVGMVARGSVASIDDEPMYLSERGVYAITTNNLTTERTVQNRSWFINNELCRQNLSEAVTISHRNRYYIVVAGNCYVLDGNQEKSFVDSTNGAFVYECYKWENIPARVLLSLGDTLMFGTEAGHLCRFNTDIDTGNRFNDDGAAIDAVWATKADDDGDFIRYKTMLKNGCGVYLKPFRRSGVAVSYRLNDDVEKEVLKTTLDNLDWSFIDFKRISFKNSDRTRIVPFKKGCKRYITLQIVVRNNNINEGFGVLGIVKRFTLGNFVK